MSFAPEDKRLVAPRRGGRLRQRAAWSPTSIPALERRAIRRDQEIRLARNRDPKPCEADLINSLGEGPRRVHEGPLGLCTKRGWIQAVAARGNTSCAGIFYEATEEGLAAAARALAGELARRRPRASLGDAAH